MFGKFNCFMIKLNTVIDKQDSFINRINALENRNKGFDKSLTALQQRITGFDKSMQDLTKSNDNLKNEIAKVKKGAHPTLQPFDPNVTVVVTNPPNTNQSPASLAHRIIDSIGIPVDVIDVLQTPVRDRHPGVLKIELGSLQTKD